MQVLAAPLLMAWWGGGVGGEVPTEGAVLQPQDAPGNMAGEEELVNT